MENLQCIDIQKTFVLDLYKSDDALTFEIDACLLPEHPLYDTPSSGNIGYYRKGKLIFQSPSKIEGLLSKKDIKPTTDPDGSIDYGELEALAINTRGDWRICGEFGEVMIIDSNLKIEL